MGCSALADATPLVHTVYDDRAMARSSLPTRGASPTDELEEDSVTGSKSGGSPFEDLNALTLFVSDMERSVRFYEALGFESTYGGSDSEFTTFDAGGGSYLNLAYSNEAGADHWGRAIFHVRDVDALYERLIEVGLHPQSPPRDAVWGERYFHITDPDGHELSMARRLDAPAQGD